MSFLSTFGKDFKAVFSWLGSSKGQTVVAAVEGGVEAVVPAATGAINLINTWGTEIIKTEAIAAAAEAQTGTGAQKAAAVITAVAPQALAFTSANGLTALTPTQLATINTALTTVYNTIGATTTAPATAA